MSETINPKPKVFIAYSSNDRDDAIKLASRLREAGIEVWRGQETIAPGYFQTEDVEAALSQCTTCLVLMGMDADKDFTQSATIGGGIGRGPIEGSPLGGFVYVGIIGAIERRIRKGNFHVIPVLLSGAKRDVLRDLPAFLQAAQCVEFPQFLDDAAAVRSLLAAIRGESPDASEMSPVIFGQINAAATIKASFSATVIRTIRLPDIDWVEIPAGPFLYGEGDTQRTLDLERFYISRYPITNVQFQTFIDAGGYRDERWWQGLQQRVPGEPKWKQPNRPRETVDWYEAVAFTRWLSAQLGYPVTLPTEAQWEKAARGTDGRDYPWGSDFQSGEANVYDSSAGDDNLKETCAVGMYPHRASPYGVLDMTGNVWEWCLNPYEAPEQVAPASNGGARVLRGGSWNGRPDYARAADRLRNFPFNRDLIVGFRVVCSFPSIGH